jgi:tRNA threonylcarbamoyl adenosine modification protein YeaZ
VLVLGLDTSTPACSVALCRAAEPDPVRELGRRQVIDPRRHGELLAPLIAETLAAAGSGVRELGAVVVGLGPGPYTSLRVGIVTAEALADALGIPAYGVCSLDGLAEPAATVTVATDARRREVYWARYLEGQRVAGPAVEAPAAVAARLGSGARVIGAGGELYASVFGSAYDPSGPRYPDPVRLVELAVAQFDHPAGPLVPLYLRRPDATPRVAA